MSDVDVAVQLHFALFNGSRSFVLKPPEMLRATSPEDGMLRATSFSCRSDSMSGESLWNEREPSQDIDDEFWPPPRDSLYHAAIGIKSLHSLPKVRARPDCSTPALQ